MATGGGGNVRQVENIFHLLDSTDTVKDVKDLILENLSSTKETWLIHLLVDYYFQTQSANVQEILAELRESQAKALMDKLHDGIKTAETRQSALQLILYLVSKELPWSHKLVDTPLFSAILKCLKSEVNVLILMTAMMIMVILLPSVPVSMGPHLTTLFDIFGRVSVLCVKKPANAPEVYILHLQVALYSLFQRLYGMYPCSFVAFIGKFYAHKENIHVYEEVLMPMLERVRLHPKILMARKETETEANRWKNQETQDIIVECSKLSLDLIEGSWEESHCPVFHSLHLLNPRAVTGEKEVSPETQTSKAVEDASHNLLYIPSLDASAMGESPSLLLGLSTPPSSQRTTPAASFLDLGSTPGLSGDTPEMTPRQHTPCQTEDGEKVEIPLSRSSSRGTFQQPRPIDCKKSGPLHTTPVTPGSHSLPSPTSYSPGGIGKPSSFKSVTSAFNVPGHSRSSAMRSLHFNSSLEERPEGEVRDQTSSPRESASAVYDHAFTSSVEGAPFSFSEEDKTSPAVTADLPTDSSPYVLDLSTPDTDKLDREVEEINENDDHFDENHSPAPSVSMLASQNDVTAESVRQFMKKVNRIRFNSLTSNSSSDYDTTIPHTTCRPRSCPPLKRPQLLSHCIGDQTCTSRGKPMKYASAGGPMVSRSFGRQKSMIVGNFGTDVLHSQDSFDNTQVFTTINSEDAFKGIKMDSKVQLDGKSMTEVVPSFPALISPVFQFILAPSKLSVCSNCHKQVVITSSQPQGADTTVTTFKGNEVSLFTAMSPPELLDRHLRLGSDIHAKELTKIPLTSKESTNWTHFGGVPPVDEINILRGQILLMQNQLMYERHKRSNHAKRNRRLLRRITHIAKLEEEQKTFMAQIHLLEEEIQQLKVSMKQLQENNTRLRQCQESDEYEKLVEYRTSLKENKDLKAASVVLKNLLLTQKEEYDKQQKKLDSVQHQNLENEKELDICKERLANTEKLKNKVFELQKEVLLMQEFHQKCQEKLQQSRAFPEQRLEESYMINSLKREMADLVKDNKRKNNLLEAYQTRMIELEQTLKFQENALNETKRNFETAKSCHDEQLKAVEDRCQSMVHINQQLEAKVMELTCQLDQRTHRKMLAAKKPATDAGDGGGSSSKRSNAASRMIESRFDQKELHPSVHLSGTAPQDSEKTKPRLKFSSISSRTVGKLDTSHSAFHKNTNRGSHPPVSLVTASDKVSEASSNFTEETTVVIPLSHLQTTDLDILEPVDRDSSMKSLSENSQATGDSGCWPKE